MYPILIKKEPKTLVSNISYTYSDGYYFQFLEPSSYSFSIKCYLNFGLWSWVKLYWVVLFIGL